MSLTAGALGAIFTASSVSSWYLELNKPFFNPPSWLFSPVWTLLYLLIGTSLFLALDKAKKVVVKQNLILLFCAQWVLNVFWTFLFFYLRSPFLGLLEIITLILVIILNITYFYRQRKIAAYLLIPYLLWVIFAANLNLAIWRLN